MTVDQKSSGAEASTGEGARWRTIGVIIMVVGIVGAGLLYGLEKPPADVSDIMPGARDSKTVTRSIEMNSGKAGVFMDDLMDDLRDPGTQALIIAVVSILAASGCFYIAQLSDNVGRRQ